ncbi:MAG: hypothetical protein RBQ97_10205 [Acholeplasma sp.]|nr:hypothetical protein [Acholeplasma sp.]
MANDKRLSRLERSQNEHKRLLYLNKTRYQKDLKTKNLIGWLYHGRLIEAQSQSNRVLSKPKRKHIYHIVRDTFKGGA